ncbi:hypothetical protein KEN51_CDS0394 [Pseudomonas phage vB_Pae10145-KEN51]|nr:hypothetical protein [Pseudomonas phage ANB1]WNV50441.1 hypothetical protein [Pseudomonas phage PhiPizzaParty]WRQ05833.1 hypothetical protein IPCDMZAV_CDS0310 [Pseudomonas phage 6B]WRQ06330.1 hypothetical protein QAMIJHJT_CDS0399 [Pseudomonas phage 9-Ps-8B]WRQ06738.1 hypothetical protein FOPPYZMZ_CDS0398 [Pseudomonas phage 9Ps-7B]WRQ07089.1 hypothetical protein ZBUARNPM_CDS0340 [Pseudomonas phage 14Ps5-6]
MVSRCILYLSWVLSPSKKRVQRIIGRFYESNY